MAGHLLHVGFPKTASNFLRRWFREHPQLAYCEGALAGYHDVYELVREGVAPRTGVLYRVTSSEAFTAPQRDAGRVFLTYDHTIDPAVAQENVCALLAALFPSSYVLIVTRGFRSIIFSSFSQYVRSGGDVPLEELIAKPPMEGPWDYDRVIGMYCAAFGEERVIVMPYELLRDDVDRFVRTLEQRLGLTHLASASDRVNTSLSPAELYWYPRLTRVVLKLPIGSRLKRMYLRGAFANRFRRTIGMLQRVRPGTPVTAEAIPEHLVAACRAKARTLRDNPLYALYARDYYQS